MRSTVVALSIATALVPLPALRVAPRSALRPPAAEQRTPAHAVTIVGTVTDGSTPLPGAQLHVRNTASAATTDSAGRYAIALSAADVASMRTAELIVRRIGYAGTTRVVRLDRDTVRADVVLAPSVLRLETQALTNEQARAMRAAVAGTAAATPAAPAKAGAADASGALTRRVTPPTFAPAPSQSPNDAYGVFRHGGAPNTEEYALIQDNPFLAVAANPLSTFSVDVDRASYSNVRRFLLGDGRRPPRDAVRIEELVNYFPYAYPEPRAGEPFSITADAAVAPWAPRHRLVRVALQARHVETAALPPSNLVFLIDVSGSMMTPDRLPLVKEGFRLLVNQLREQDRVAIVVYAGNAGLVLPSTSGADKARIIQAIDALEAGGSTAGGAGISLAYDVARQHFLPGGNNRVILATDGDFNVGVSSEAELVRLVERRRTEGTFLTVLGFGRGNLKDSRMEQLADKGNGHYAYVDDGREARKVFVTELGGTLVTVAKDVKLQVEFNPAKVGAYRLIGYENRLLRDEDFNDDAKDAGEVGAGHSVTALYEVVMKGDEGDVVRGVDSLRYARPRADAGAGAPSEASAARSGGDELLFVKVRYKAPNGERSLLLTRAVPSAAPSAPVGEFAFAAAVAEFGMVLRESPFMGAASLDDAAAMARRSLGSDPFGYRAEFVRMVERARGVDEVARR